MWQTETEMPMEAQSSWLRFFDLAQLLDKQRIAQIAHGVIAVCLNP